jgi:threonine/homoserine/homoserine lactone efflux protein
MWIQLIQVLTYGFAAAVQPGPLTIYLISETARAGWRRTLPAVFAPLLSDGPIAVLMVLLLSRAPVRFLQLLLLPGGMYVLYLAVGAWRTRRSPGGSGTPAQRNRTLFKAAVVNLLNPNVYLGWALVLGPLLLSAWREAPARGVAVVLTFYLTMIACLAALILMVHAAGNLVPRFNRALVAVSALALAAFGVYLLAEGVKSLAACLENGAWEL